MSFSVKSNFFVIPLFMSRCTITAELREDGKTTTFKRTIDNSPPKYNCQLELEKDEERFANVEAFKNFIAEQEKMK